MIHNGDVICDCCGVVCRRRGVVLCVVGREKGRDGVVIRALVPVVICVVGRDKRRDWIVVCVVVVGGGDERRDRVAVCVVPVVVAGGDKCGDRVVIAVSVWWDECRDRVAAWLCCLYRLIGLGRRLLLNDPGDDVTEDVETLSATRAGAVCGLCWEATWIGCPWDIRDVCLSHVLRCCREGILTLSIATSSTTLSMSTMCSCAMSTVTSARAATAITSSSSTNSHRILRPRSKSVV